MLNQFMIEKLDDTELREWNHLRECYWDSTDDLENTTPEKSAEDLLTQEKQLKNLLDYERSLQDKYISKSI